MKWSELPQQYRDLQNTFNKELCFFVFKCEYLKQKFEWAKTPQGKDFWNECEMAKTISELPQIPKNDK